MRVFTILFLSLFTAVNLTAQLDANCVNPGEISGLSACEGKSVSINPETSPFIRGHCKDDYNYQNGYFEYSWWVRTEPGGVPSYLSIDEEFTNFTMPPSGYIGISRGVKFINDNGQETKFVWSNMVELTSPCLDPCDSIRQVLDSLIYVLDTLNCHIDCDTTIINIVGNDSLLIDSLIREINHWQDRWNTVYTTLIDERIRYQWIIDSLLNLEPDTITLAQIDTIYLHDTVTNTVFDTLFFTLPPDPHYIDSLLTVIRNQQIIIDSLTRRVRILTAVTFRQNEIIDSLLNLPPQIDTVLIVSNDTIIVRDSTAYYLLLTQFLNYQDSVNNSTGTLRDTCMTYEFNVDIDTPCRIEVYPNPATNGIWIDILGVDKARVLITNDLGQPVTAFDWTEKVWVTLIDKGLYCINFQIESGGKQFSITKKIIVQ